MNKSINRSIAGKLLTVDQVCQLSNLGRTAVRRIATESGAVRKIGGSYRVDREIFFNYIDKICQG